MTWSVHAACRRTIPERIAVRPAAISAGGGIDACVRHHGLRQSGARLALHDGRLLRGDLCGVDGEFRPRHHPRARRARHQYQAALYAGVRARRGAGRSRWADAGADFDRADRDGRKHPHPRLRHHRDRRDRLDPRRVPGRDLCRHDRYAGPRLPARPVAADAEFDRRFDRGSRALLDADLSVDGDRAGAAAGGAVSGQPAMKDLLNARNVIVALVIAGLLLLPLYTSISGNIFVLTLFTRIVIFALAAASLNLIMGYGGMMSFGHAAYLGIGGYAVGILAHEGIGSGLLQWPGALAPSALYAL